MKNTRKELFWPLSKSRLRFLIKSHGLQTSMFNSGLLVFDWDGSEYLFHMEDGRLILYSVRIECDVILGELGDLPVY